jgi:hypothetical protein
LHSKQNVFFPKGAVIASAQSGINAAALRQKIETIA